MQPMGHLDYKDGYKTPYFDLRYNHHTAFMSDKPLGLQALIDFLGAMMWINIRKSWLS